MYLQYQSDNIASTEIHSVYNTMIIIWKVETDKKFAQTITAKAVFLM